MRLERINAIDFLFASLKSEKELKLCVTKRNFLYLIHFSVLPPFKFPEFLLHQPDFFGLCFKNIFLQRNQLWIGEMCFFGH